MNRSPVADTGRACSRKIGSADDGFTIIEVVTAIAIVMVVMTSLAAFFVNSAGVADMQSQRQTASQVATDAIEAARSRSETGLAPYQASSSAWADARAGSSYVGVAGYLSNVAQMGGTSTPGGALSGNSVTLNRLAFKQYWFLGYCYASKDNAGACSASTGTGLTKYIQVVVDITWANKRCNNGICSYVTATRISPTPDPLFDAAQSAPRPKIVNPGNQVADIGVAISSLPVRASGGTAPLTWTSANLPAGLSVNTGTTPVSISGTPSATGIFKTTLTLTDAFNFTSTAAFTWIVTAKPSFTTPPAQVTTVNTAGNLNMGDFDSGGAAPLTFSASGLPAGLGINASTGAITGTANTQRAASNVVVTLKDGVNQTATTTFPWSVVAAPTVSAVSALTTAEYAAPSSPIDYACPNGPCRISLQGSVPGIGLSTALDSNDDNTASSLVTVATGNGTVYLNGSVSASAVSGTTDSSTASYTPTVAITDADAVSASDNSSWTVRIKPYTTWPGHLSVARGSTQATQYFAGCDANASSCTIALSGAPSGVALASSAQTTSQSTTSGTLGGGNHFVTGRVSSTATIGSYTLTLTVTQKVGNATTSISSVGVWVVT